MPAGPDRSGKTALETGGNGRRKVALRHRHPVYCRTSTQRCENSTEKGAILFPYKTGVINEEPAPLTAVFRGAEANRNSDTAMVDYWAYMLFSLMSG